MTWRNCLICILATACICLSSGETNGQHLREQHKQHHHTTKFKKFVFIDVGGNIADTVELFLEKGVHASPIPSKEYDSIYVFEPNEKFHPLYDKFRNQSYNFTLIKAAATSVDGHLNFAGDGIGGSTLVESSNNDKNDVSKVSVASVDFSGWLKRTVEIDDYVVCKMDAEGSEYEIVQKMFVDGTLCLCDRLAIEWHGWLCRKEGGEFKGLVDFNDPSKYTDIPGNHTDSSPEPCLGLDCICRIPHLDLELPHYYCTLPRVLVWARSACVGHGVRKDHLLENHDHNWFNTENR